MFAKQNIHIFHIMLFWGTILSLFLLASSPVHAKSRCSGYDNADCLLTRFLAQNPITRGKSFKRARKKKRTSKKKTRKIVPLQLVTLPIQRPHKSHSNYALTVLKSHINLKKEVSKTFLAPSLSPLPQLTKKQAQNALLAEEKLFNSVPKVASIIIGSHVKSSCFPKKLRGLIEQVKAHYNSET